LESQVLTLRSIFFNERHTFQPTRATVLERCLHLLEIGAAGRLVLNSELGSVKPLEESMIHQQANPVKDGRVVFDEKINKQREDAMAKILIDGDPFCVIVLGNAHDLSDNLRAQTFSSEYIKIELRSIHQAGK
jgi:hypothetical protein